MTRKCAILLSFAVAVLMATSANAQYSRISLIVNSYHDMSSTSTRTVKAVSNTQICYYCHTPHQMEETIDSAVTTPPNGQAPLWNHYLSSKASYGVYSSASFDALGTDVRRPGRGGGGIGEGFEPLPELPRWNRGSQHSLQRPTRFGWQCLP